MNTWTIKNIGSLGRIITGQTPSTKEIELWNGAIPFVSPKDMKWDTFYLGNTKDTASKRMAEKYKSLVVPKNAVMYTALSYGFGKMAISTKTAIANRQIHSICVNSEHCYRFVFYLLRFSTPYIFAFNSGIDTPIVPKSVFSKIELKVPPLPVQEKISAILSAYDDLIENNKRRIALLEKMAEEIYREWFVRFRFPGYQDAEFEKGIPKGWGREKLEKLCVTIKRGISPKYNDVSSRLVINQKCIRDGRIDLSEARTHDSAVAGDKYIKYLDALINSTGVGTLGRVSVVEFQPENITVDSHVTICRANEKVIDPLYLSTTVAKLQTYFEFMAAGSTGQVELNKSLIEGIKVLVPNPEIQILFRNLMEPICKQKQVFTKEIAVLEKAKGMLLPRLISGKLSVENLDIKFPPSMQV